MQPPNAKIEYVHYFMLVVRKRKGLIAYVALGTLISVCFFGFLITPVWEGTSLVLVERASKQSLGLFKDVDMPVSESGGGVALELIPTLTGWNMAYDIVKKYRLDERLRVRRQERPTLRDKIKGLIADVVYSPLTLMEWLGLRASGEPDWVDKAAEDFVEDWLDIEEVEEGTSVISLTVYGETEELATEISNDMVTMLREKTRSFTREGAENSLSFVENQVEVAAHNQRQAEGALAAYKAANRLFSLEDDRRLKVEKIDQFQTALLNTQKERQEAEANEAAVARELARTPERRILSATLAKNPVIVSLEDRIVDLDLKRASLLVEKEEGHPDLQILSAQMAQAKAELRSAVQSVVEAQTEAINPDYQDLLSRSVDLKVQTDTLAARQKSFKDIVTTLERDLDKLPEKEIELRRLSQIVEINKSVYDTLKTRLERLKIEQTTENNEYNIRVLDRAFVPPSRDQDWPVWWLNIAVGMFLGGIFGFGTAFVMEYWNEPVLTVSDVEEGIGVPLLGRIGDLTPPAR
jgi:uncharacterized protein involved in exopolysaccharide biosynthesis